MKEQFRDIHSWSASTGQDGINYTVLSRKRSGMKEKVKRGRKRG